MIYILLTIITAVIAFFVGAKKEKTKYKKISNEQDKKIFEKAAKKIHAMTKEQKIKELNK